MSVTINGRKRDISLSKDYHTDDTLRSLLRIIPEELVPENHDERVQLLAELSDGNLLRGRRRLDSGHHSSGSKTSVVKEYIDQQKKNRVKSGMLELSNFHLGLEHHEEGEDDEDEIESYVGNSALTRVQRYGKGATPAGFGANALSFKLKDWDKQPFAPLDDDDIDTYPLRQDGTAKRWSDQEHYNEKWMKEYYERMDAMERDPYYIFLTEIAGGANTTVDRLQNPSNVESRQLQLRLFAQSQTEAMRARVVQYKKLLDTIAKKERDLEDLRAKLPSIDEFKRVVIFAGDTIAKIDSATRSLADAVWRKRFFELMDAVATPLFNNPFLLTTSSTGEINNLIQWENVLQSLFGSSGDSSNAYLNRVDELLAMIRSPITTVRGIADTTAEDIGNTAARVDVESLEGIGSTEAENALVYASTYAETLIISGDTQGIFKNIQRNIDDLNSLSLARTDNDVVSTKLMFIVLYLGVERGLYFPGGGGGITSDVRNEYIEAISERPGPVETIVDKVSEGYSTSVGSSPTLFAMSGSSPAAQDISQEKARYTNFTQTYVSNLKDTLTRAWSFLGLRDFVTRFVVEGGKAQERLARADPVREMAVVRATTRPVEVIRLATGDIMNLLITYRDASTTSGEMGIQKDVNDAEKALSNMRLEATSLSDAISSNEAVTVPYVPDPEWRFREMFTGRVGLQPIVHYAITQAIVTVKERIPGLLGDIEEKSALDIIVNKPEYRAHFSNIVLVFMFRARSMFQVRLNIFDNSEEAAKRIANAAINSLRRQVGLTTNGYAGGTYPSSFYLRSPREKEIYTIADSVPRALVYDRFT